MSPDKALELLHLGPQATTAEIASAYQARYQELRFRSDNAPAAALRQQFEQALREIEEAYSSLGDGPDAPYPELPGSRHPERQAERTMGLLLLRCTEACTVALDYGETTRIEARSAPRLLVVAGVHVVQATSESGALWESNVHVRSREETIVIIDFR